MNETTFRSYISAFKSADRDEMLRNYAPDVTMSFANGATLEGHEIARSTSRCTPQWTSTSRSSDQRAARRRGD